MELAVQLVLIALYVLVAVVGLCSIPLGAYRIGRYLYDPWRWPRPLVVLGTAVATVAMVLGGWVVFDVVVIGTWLSRRLQRLVRLAA